MPRNKAFNYKSQKNNSRAAACIAAYSNPFRDTVQNAKIPDGSANLSCGVRMQANNIVAGDAGGKFSFVCQPHYTDPVLYDKTKLDNIGAGLTAGSYLQPIENAVLSKWRLVSQGMKLSSTANTDNNQGYFEAIRFDSHAPIDVAILNMVTNPTYINGKVRDLHRYHFQLKPRSTDHEFKDPGNALDNQFDSILVVLSGCAPSTNILVHTVANIEFIFKEGSLLQRFMDGAVSDQNGLHRAQAYMMNSIKAGTVSSY
jgi:hypothetical protein